MTKINLAEHLPPFLAELKELAVLFSSENPEFDQLWDETQGVLDDQYVDTAGERGIVRLEKITGIPTDRSLTLAERKTRIITRINEELPYTLRKLNDMLEAVCGKENFSIVTDFPNYVLGVVTVLRSNVRVESAEQLLERVVPANMVIKTKNSVSESVGGGAYFAGAVGEHHEFTVGMALDRKENIGCKIFSAGTATVHREIFIG